MTTDQLLRTIHALRARYIAGDNDAGADLHAWRIRLLKQLYGRRCQGCGVVGTRLCATCEGDERWCQVCDTVKPIAAFYRRPDTGRRRRTCVACTSTLHRQRYPETRKRATAHFHERNPTYRATQNKRAYQADPEAEKRRAMAWREENKERYAAQQRVWRERRRTNDPQ